MERYAYNSDLNRADNYRYSSLSRGLENLFEYPLGGLGNTAYYHNMWLDIGRVSGLFPFLVMVFYSILTDVHALKIIINKQHATWFRYILLCIYVGVQINFFTEPVLEGLYGFFLNFIIINGMVEAYYYRYERTAQYVAENV